VILAEKGEGSLAELSFVVLLFSAFPENLVAFDCLLLFFGEWANPDYNFQTLAFALHEITNI